MNTILLALTMASAAHAAPATLPLQLMTYDEGGTTGTLGTGCTWKTPADRKRETWRISMTDGRAGVKIGGRLRTLGPAKDAKEMFPFTFDKWTDGRVTISIRETGPTRRVGTEAMETPATLSVQEAGRLRTWRGTLSCGS